MSRKSQRTEGGDDQRIMGVASRASDDQTGVRRRMRVQLNRVEHSSAPTAVPASCCPLVVSVRLIFDPIPTTIRGWFSTLDLCDDDRR